MPTQPLISLGHEDCTIYKSDEVVEDKGLGIGGLIFVI